MEGPRVLKGFKDFLLRGNVVDLAVAVVIGAAFTTVVTAFTSAFLKPLIQLATGGGGQLAGTFVVNGVVFDYASFINALITFVITAAVIYFLVVLPLKIVAERRKRGEEAGPAEPTDVELLTEIRDLLREQGRPRRDDGGTAGRIPHQDR
jgi:large conductance mechanosensitive channel